VLLVLHFALRVRSRRRTSDGEHASWRTGPRVSRTCAVVAHLRRGGAPAPWWRTGAGTRGPFTHHARTSVFLLEHVHTAMRQACAVHDAPRGRSTALRPCKQRTSPYEEAPVTYATAMCRPRRWEAEYTSNSPRAECGSAQSVSRETSAPAGLVRRLPVRAARPGSRCVPGTALAEGPPMVPDTRLIQGRRFT
jgi:hypothetical protein